MQHYVRRDQVQTYREDDLKASTVVCGSLCPTTQNMLPEAHHGWTVGRTTVTRHWPASEAVGKHFWVDQYVLGAIYQGEKR